MTLERLLRVAWFAFGLGVALTPSLLMGCGGEKWLPQDQAADTTAIRLEVSARQECAPGAPCDPAKVRALLRTPICDHAANLTHHGAPVPDLGGVQCQPK